MKEGSDAYDYKNRVLYNFWRHHFPRIWKEGLEQFVTCGGTFKLEQCEIVPRDENKDGKTVMNRHLFFRTPEELFTYCVKWKPLTLQLGGIYPITYPELDDYACKEADNQLIKVGATTTQKPFVLDFDMDEKLPRSGICQCVKTETCVLCWNYYLHSTRLIVDFLLRNVCKMRKISHFWSGRRGLHIWCHDSQAIAWSKEERTNVMKVFTNRDAVVHLLPLELQQLPWPQFDVAVSVDQRHCIGLPLLPHHSTKCIRRMLPLLSDPTKFDPRASLAQARVSSISLDEFQFQVNMMNRILNE